MHVDTPATIAILGAGPIGLEAALYARYLGYDVRVYERGRVAESVRRWGHVRMFSPFGMNRSSLGLAALHAQDESFVPPRDDELLTGEDLVTRYLEPLAQSDLLHENIHTNVEVLAIARSGMLKSECVGDPARARRPFRLLLRSGRQQRYAKADVVLDTTGTFGNPNHLGPGGMPAVGERAAAGAIEFGLPDLLGRDRDLYSGKRVLVVGGGYSAATTVTALADLAKAVPGTSISWITRSDGEPLARIENDRLPERDRLAAAANALVSGSSPSSSSSSTASPVTHLPRATITHIRRVKSASESSGSGGVEFELRLVLPGGRRERLTVDRIVANVGYRPDGSLYSELQVHECYASGGPMRLAAALAQAAAQRGNETGEVRATVDCLDQKSTGPLALVTTEPNFYILGAKSYGRNPQFLISVGLSQIRELFTLIGGRAGLDLYATAQMPST